MGLWSSIVNAGKSLVHSVANVGKNVSNFIHNHAGTIKNVTGVLNTVGDILVETGVGAEVGEAIKIGTTAVNTAVDANEALRTGDPKKIGQIGVDIATGLL